MPVHFLGVRPISKINMYSLITEYIIPMLPIFVLVLMSEMVVDWIKHAFITKFNDISPDVYRKYRAILSKDLVTSRHGNVRMKSDALSCCYLGVPIIPSRLKQITVIWYLGEWGSFLYHLVVW